MTTINLAGTWRLRCDARSIEVDYPVPGDVHSALISAGQIPHPYKGMNELACRWVADEEWVATTRFNIETIEAGEYYLDIDYLDTVADVSVNGVHVLHAENCFRRYKPDVTKALQVGENVVEVTLHSNTKAANEKQAAQPFYIPYSVSNNPIPNGNMLRKPQCHFGWDWNLAVVPFGLCGDVRLSKPQAFSIHEISVAQDHFDDGAVQLVLSLKLKCRRPGATAKGHFSFDGRVQEFEVIGELEFEPVNGLFHIELPKLWWPAGQGEQFLYDLEIKCGDEIERRKIGLRKLELITDKDETGSRFAVKINGREVFCKGANWIPADALPSNATQELTRKLLQAAKDANMNTIRVWGGGYYEQDFFYEICDELGLLVWQDFMFSCSLYPSTTEFLDEVKKEAAYQVQRLQHHACVAVWCGDNELLGALTWFEESRKNRDRYLVNYDRLNRTLEEAVKDADPSAIWWPSSPSPGILDFGDTWHDDSKGDMHFWSVWHEGKDFEHYRDVRPRFCSEFGFQSFPSLRLIKEFSESPEDLNISSAVMEHHQRNKGGNARIAETMFRNFRFPMDFGNFVYVSQIQQGLAMQTAVDYWRSLKPHCMGTLYWQLNDTWPVASWSGLDHGGSWKALHYMARDFYAPVSVVAIPDKANRQVSFMAINDRPESVALEVQRLYVTEEGDVVHLPPLKALVPTDHAIEIGVLARADLPIGALLFWSFDGIRRHFTFQPYKFLTLPKPDIALEFGSGGGVLNFTLLAKQLALHVTCECDVAGHFSCNVFDLLPGESRAIIFAPDNPADLARAKDTLLIRDLYSSSH